MTQGATAPRPARFALRPPSAAEGPARAEACPTWIAPRAKEEETSWRLHPENAELRAFRDGRVQRRGEGEAEHVPGLRRVDDAVVPQPGSRVPGIALRFIVLADRL